MKLGKFRISVQLIVLILITVVAFMHQILGGGFTGSPTVHALCPFGTLESLYNLIINKGYIAKTYYSNTVLLIGTLVLVLVVGRIFCGWICALGTMQDIPTFFIKKRKKIPEYLDNYLIYVKYIVLITIIYFTWKTGTLVVNPYDPFAAYSHIPAGIESVISEYLWGLILLLLIIASSLKYDRLFCKYLCPLGAFYAIISKISIFKIKRKVSSCISCKKCDRSCPANLTISNKESVKIENCYSCMKCVDGCPTKPGSLKVEILKKEYSPLKTSITGLIFLIILISLTKMIGLFQTMPNTMEGILKGDPNNIRGWMTYEQIIKEFKLDESEVYKKLGFTKEELPLDTIIKKSDIIYEKKGLKFDDEIIKEVTSQLIGKEKKIEISKNQYPNFTGTMTIKNLSETLKIQENEVIEKFKLPSNIPRETPLKELKVEYKLNMEEIRLKYETVTK